MTPRADQLPKELVDLANWVGWRNEAREGSTKLTKVPYDLKTDRKASSTNPATWSQFPALADLPADLAGFGFALDKKAGIAGLDLDNCYIPETHTIKPWAQPILHAFRFGYREISPSGRGIKVFFYGTLPGPGKKIYVDADGNPTVESMSDGAIEMYDSGRYFTVTGRAIGPLVVGNCQTVATELYPFLAGKTAAAAPEPADGEVVTEGNRHGYLLTVAGRLRNQGFDRDAMLVSIRALNAAKCSPPKPDREIVGIVDFLMGKPSKYKLMPDDVAASRTADGKTAEFPQPAEEPAEDPKPDTSGILAYAESVFATALASGDPKEILAPLVINALAQAGHIKQFEAKRRIKEAKLNVSLREFDALIKAAEIAARPALGESAFLLTSEGSMQTNLANAKIMLENIPVLYNAFTCRLFLPEMSPWETIGDWKDYDDAQATIWCQRKDLNVLVNVVATAAETLARSRPHYYPVRKKINSLKWDGVPRLNTWLEQYLGVKQTEYVRQVSRKFLIQAIKRSFEPGCQADYTLVLEGDQGKRKSSALRTLCLDPEWFSDDITDMGSKDAAMQLQGKTIVEISELDALHRSEMTTAKAFLVRRIDRFRPPYGRRAEDFARQNVFAATTNKTDWLQDDTGGRRFWPVLVGLIDLDGLEVNRDQLWAEAMFYYLEGEKSYFSEIAESLATEEQHARQDVDAWTDHVVAWAAAPTGSPSLDSDRERIFLPEILQYCLSIPTKDWNNVQRARISRILRIAGYKSKRMSQLVNGKRPEYWVKK